MFPLFTLDSFIALMLVGPSKSLKRIILIKHNGVKNPNWPEAKYLAIYWEQIQLAVRVAELELGASELQVQRSNHSATLPLYG